MNIVAIILCVAGSAIGFIAWWHKRISTKALCGLLIALGVASIFIFNAERILPSRVSGKSVGGEFLAEFQAIKKDINQKAEAIYAKEKSVQKIGYAMADLAQFSVLESAPLLTRAQREQFLKNQNKIISIMEEINSGDQRINELKRAFRDKLRQYLYTVLTVSEKDDSVNPALREKIKKELQGLPQPDADLIVSVMGQINKDWTEELPDMLEDFKALE